MAKQNAAITAGSLRFPNGTVVETGQIGHGTQWTAEPGRLRSARLPAEEDTSIQFRLALDEQGFREQETIHLDVMPPPRGSRLRSQAPTAGDDLIRLQPAPPPPDTAQVVLYQDESGGLSWHFAQSANGPRLRSSAAAQETFVIPARTAHTQAALRSPQAGARLRGPITKWGRKIFKILLVPLEQLAGPPLEAIVRRTEEKYRHELIRAITPANFAQPVTEAFNDWAALDGKRSLLIVHGIFSSTHGTLASFPPHAMAELCARYEGRVLGFDQITVSRSPQENAQFFLEQFRQARPQGRFEFDILCHSRGGIVARTLAERGHVLVGETNCVFPKVFFVAAPNNGSVLGDPAHVVEMLDTFTNILTWFPDGAVMYSIEILLAIVKLLVHTAERRLPGLAAMGTNGYIQQKLNAATEQSPSNYGAASADYTPDPNAANSLLNGRFGNCLLDRVFMKGDVRIANDLIVPKEGVFERNGHPSFPIVKPLIFSENDRVWHCNFFQQPRLLQRVNEHFGAEETVLLADAQRSRLRGEVKPPVPRMRSDEKAVAKSPADLRREPHIDFREMVHEGEANDLVVRLEEALVNGGAGVLWVALPPGQSSVELPVTINAPGFDVTHSDCAAVKLSAVRDPELEKTTFTLTARHPGPNPVRREIRADFWLDGSPVGSVRHRTFVIPKGYTGPKEGDGSGASFGLIVPSVPREGSDFTVFVEGEDEPGEEPWVVRISSQIPGREYASKRTGKFRLDSGGVRGADYLQSIYQKHFATFPPDSLSEAEFAAALTAWEENFNRELDALGRTLWLKLPQTFRDEYFSLYQGGLLPRSILVHSDETILPWDLIVPHGVIDGRQVVLEPWGAAHILGRWKPGLPIKPHPQRLAVRKFIVVHPAYGNGSALAGVSEEMAELKELCPGISFVSPATLANVSRTVLDDGDIQLVHFSGHGAFESSNTDLSGLTLEDGELSASLVTGARFAAEGQPIVLLNACSVGGSGIVIGKMGGFAANLLESGASGVIAAYWPVLDNTAVRFAVAFYSKLKLGRAMGEALQELRQENPRDPTYRAFGYFGDPWARVDLALVS
jgi:hypothetical protein